MLGSQRVKTLWGGPSGQPSGERVKLLFGSWPRGMFFPSLEEAVMGFLTTGSGENAMGQLYQNIHVEKQGIQGHTQ